MSTPASPPPASVEVEGLVKRFGATTALDGVSFAVAPGELFGLIGPDGAGKSTLFRILVTVLTPDAGRAAVDGLDVVAGYRAIRRRVGYMPGRFSLYPDLTVAENLAFFASVFGTSVEEGYDTIAPIYSQIEPFRDRRAGDLSGGMKQKLALSCALVHRPRVLFLDEPTTGVDAVSRREFWDVLAALKAGGLTTVVSTPYMDEAARCDRVALIQGGRLLGPPDTPEAVAAGLGAPLARVRADGERVRFLAALRALPGVGTAHLFGDWVHVTGAGAGSPEDLAGAVRHALEAQGWRGVEAEAAEPTIEDTFMARMHPDTPEPADA